MHMNIFIVYISMPTECSITLLTKLSSCVFADDKLLWYMPMEKFVDELSWRFFRRLCVFKSQTISYIFYQLIESEAYQCIAHVEN